MLTIGVIAAATYYNVVLGTSADPAPAVALTMPEPQQQAAPSSVPADTPPPDHRAAPSLVAVTMPPPDHRAAPSLVALTTPPPDHRAAPLLAALTTPPPDHRAAPLLAALTTPPPDHRAAPLLAALITPPPDHRAAPPLVALASPEPGHLPNAPGDNAVASAGYPPHAVDPSRTLSSNWVVALIISKPPVGTGTSTVPANAAAPHVVPPAPLAVPPHPEPLPTDSALHLWIVYRPSDQEEGARVEALSNRLRSQNSDITSATASVGPAAKESVVYFFPNDRAGASRIAASLARITKRAAPVMLVHPNRLPRPGTVEVRLSFKVGKDLNNEGY